MLTLPLQTMSLFAFAKFIVPYLPVRAIERKNVVACKLQATTFLSIGV